MNENNNLEQEIQQEDKNAKLQVRTKASLVSEFKISKELLTTINLLNY